MAFIKAYCAGVISIREKRDAQKALALCPIQYVPHQQTADALATVGPRDDHVLQQNDRPALRRADGAGVVAMPTTALL